MSAEIAPTRQFFRTLNRIVEPAVRRGFGTSVHGPGIFVVETTGRRSGQRRRVPLLGWRSGDTVWVSTVRADSDWVRNVEHDPAADVWINGRRRPSVATVTRTPNASVVQLSAVVPRRSLTTVHR
jgi:deazaflavin-dependent oxidoreductase (nitroreductase family)